MTALDVDDDLAVYLACVPQPEPEQALEGTQLRFAMSAAVLLSEPRSCPDSQITAACVKVHDERLSGAADGDLARPDCSRKRVGMNESISCSTEMQG